MHFAQEDEVRGDPGIVYSSRLYEFGTILGEYKLAKRIAVRIKRELHGCRALEAGVACSGTPPVLMGSGCWTLLSRKCHGNRGKV
jgi:hypothetical protein